MPTLSNDLSSPHLLAVVPAAGIGKRMGSVVPKQYLSLIGRTVIEHALQRLCDHAEIKQVVVAISQSDSYWPDLAVASHPKIQVVFGGKERCHSVLNALNFLRGSANPEDLVLVHDAARPCLSNADLNQLISIAKQQKNGALLGFPVHDTIKKVNSGSNVVHETVDRTELWQAQTPQIFPVGMLTAAMQQAIDQNRLVTDEASAMELAGFFPVMVEGSDKNIKITRPEDLELAEYFLSHTS